MAYQVKKDSGFAIIHLVGDIDLSCSPEARKAILDCLRAAQPTLVDLSGVTHCQSMTYLHVFKILSMVY